MPSLLVALLVGDDGERTREHVADLWSSPAALVDMGTGAEVRAFAGEAAAAVVPPLGASLTAIAAVASTSGGGFVAGFLPATARPVAVMGLPTAVVVAAGAKTAAEARAAGLVERLEAWVRAAA